MSHHDPQPERPERSWAPVDAQGSVDEHGFLHEEGSWWGRASSTGLFRLGDLWGERCLVLLGESGAGKTFELDREERDQRAMGGLVRSLRFSALGRGGLGYRDVFDGAEVERWRAGGAVLHLLLDGIDEAVETPERIADILADLLRSERGDLSKLRLRLTGRSSAWSASMRDSLRRVFGTVNEYAIQPLRRSQVERWFAAEGLGDGPSLLGRLVDKGLGPLAARPITLGLLVKHLRAREGAIEARSAADLYREALFEGRRSSLHGVATNERLALGRRLDEVCCVLGAMTILGDQQDFVQEPVPGGPDDTVLRALLDRGMEEHLWRDVFVHGEFVRAGDRHRWQHASFAEFHTARWLAEHGETPEAKLRWLRGASEGGLDALPPPVEAAAAWLAEMDDTVFDRLLSEAPPTIVRCDRARLDASRRVRLVEALLARPDALTYGWQGSAWALRGLDAPAVDEVLARCIRDLGRSQRSRHLALHIAALCESTSLGRLAAQVACDGREDREVRGAALRVVGLRGDLEARRALRALPELADHALDDASISLRYRALSAIWRREREDDAAATIEEVLGWIVPGSEEAVHECEEFLSHRLAPTLRDDELSTALRWATMVLDGKSERRISLDQDVVSAFTERAWGSASMPTVADELAAFFLADVHDAHSFSSTQSNGEPRPTHAVRAVIEAIVRRHEADDSRAHFRLEQLVASQPWDWLVEQIHRDHEHAKTWATLAFWCVREVLERSEAPSSPEAIAKHTATFDRFWEARRRSKVLRKVSRWYCKDGIALDNEWVRHERERHAKKFREEAMRVTATESLRERVRDLWDRLDSDPVDAFWQFVRWCRTSTTRGDRYRLHHEWQLDESPWWSMAALEERERVVRAAERYLTLGDSHADEWFGANKWDYRAEAGALALLLLERYEPTALDALETGVWARWIPSLLYFSQLQGTAPAAGSRLLPRAASKAPDAFAAWVDREVANEVEAHRDVFVLRRVPQREEAPVARRLLAQRLLDRLPSVRHAHALQALLTFLYDDSPTSAESFALGALASLPFGEQPEPALCMGAAAFLLQCGDDRAWDAVWKRVNNDPLLGEQLLKRGAWPGERDNFWRLDARSTAALRELWEWLIVRWPYQERLAGIRDVITGEEVRDAVLTALVHRATDLERGEGALQTLRSMQIDHPELRWLPRVVTQAERDRRVRQWQPWPPHQIARGA